MDEGRGDSPGVIIDLQNFVVRDTVHTTQNPNGFLVVKEFRNIKAINAIPYLANTVIGPASGAAWVVDDSAHMNVAGVSLGGIHYLVGGTGTDTFTVSGAPSESFFPVGPLGLSIDGGNGSDTYDIT